MKPIYIGIADLYRSYHYMHPTHTYVYRSESHEQFWQWVNTQGTTLPRSTRGSHYMSCVEHLQTESKLNQGLLRGWSSDQGDFWTAKTQSRTHDCNMTFDPRKSSDQEPQKIKQSSILFADQKTWLRQATCKWLPLGLDMENHPLHSRFFSQCPPHQLQWGDRERLLF